MIELFKSVVFSLKIELEPVADFISTIPENVPVVPINPPVSVPPARGR